MYLCSNIKIEEQKKQKNKRHEKKGKSRVKEKIQKRMHSTLRCVVRLFAWHFNASLELARVVCERIMLVCP